MVRRASFIKQFEGPAEGSGIVCFRFWELVVAAGCPYECAYCFLQATPSYVYGHYPLKGAIFSNCEQMLDEVRRWLSHPVPRMLLVGELQDGLAFEGAYKQATGRSITEMLVPLFAAQKGHRLIFLTKSIAVRYLLAMEPTDRVVLSWSINADEVARRWEVGAPLPSRRLEAARKVKEAGWPVRVRLDPMIPVVGWQNAYERTIQQINDLEPEMVTIGALRASRSLQARVRRNGRDGDLFNLLTEKDPSGFKKRLPHQVQLDLFRFAIERLQAGNIVPALCKEDVALWRELGLGFQGCHCLLSKKDEIAAERAELFKTSGGRIS
jgi:spore photoproduct lyase